MTFPKDEPNASGESFPDVMRIEDLELEIASVQNPPPEDAIRKKSDIFNKIFHKSPNKYLALKLYGRILPANSHKHKLKPGDSRWMIHPYSYFK